MKSDAKSDQKALLDVYDQTYRRGAKNFDPASSLERSPTSVRIIGPDRYSASNCVLWTGLSSTSDFGTHQTVDAINTEIERFKSIRHDFEWKYLDYDAPQDLPDLLVKQGFKAAPGELVMALCLEKNPTLPLSYRSTLPAYLKRVVDRQGIEDVRRVQSSVYGESFEWLPHHLTREIESEPESLSVFAAYVGNEPVAAAWIRYRHPYATLHGGSTLKGYRGAGIYRALLALRTREAQMRGVKTLFADVSERSRSVLEKRGFSVLARTTPYLYKFK